MPWDGLDAPADPPDDALDAAIPAIVTHVRTRTGVDLAVFRRPMLDRRIRTRMMSVGTPSATDYLQRLHDEAGEAELLLQRITIKVSRFYRNASAFDALRDALAARPARSRVTIWSAGCGRGEEAWTLAMLLAEADLAGQVVATDLDPAALELARRGRYRADGLDELPERLRRRFLRPVDDGATFEVSPELRELVQFRIDDLTAATPPRDALHDVVCCRNVAIYFVPDVQRRVLRRLARALGEGGLLLLGESEWPIDQFERPLRPLCTRERLFVVATNSSASASSPAPAPQSVDDRELA